MRDAPNAARDAVTAPIALTLLLAGVTGLAPFAMQAVAPATPAIERGLDVSAAAAQLFVSLSIGAAAVGAILYGPLADRYGRRPVLLAGLVCAVLGSTLTTAAPEFWSALAGRILQSLGAGAGMVLSRAVARDLFDQAGAAALIARITGVMVAAPMAAPVVGGLLIETAGWRSVFALIAVLSAAMTVWAWRALPETLERPTDRLDIASVAAGYADIGRRRAFWANAGFACGSIAAFFAYVGGAPRVMEASYGVGPTAYGLYFAAGAAIYMAANFASPWATRRLGADRLIRCGAAAGTLGPLAFGVAMALGVDGPLVLTAAASAHAVAVGLAQPNAMAGAVSAAPDRAGSASSLLSVAQFGVAGVAAQAVSVLPSEAPWALVVLMSAVSAAAWFAYIALSRPAAVSAAGGTGFDR